MSLLRGIRHRLRRTNPCTSILIIAFVASVVFLTTAVLNTFDHRHRSSTSALHHHGDLVKSPSPSSGKNQRRHRIPKTGNGAKLDFVVVGDDEIQTCQMTPQWISSGRSLVTIDDGDRSVSQVAPSLSSTMTSSRRRGERIECDRGYDRSTRNVDELFLVDRQDGTIRVNHTWWQHRSPGPASELLSCEYRVVMRSSGTVEGYVFSEPIALVIRSPPENDVIDVGQHEFVHIACLVALRENVIAGTKREDREPQAVASAGTFSETEQVRGVTIGDESGLRYATENDVTRNEQVLKPTRESHDTNRRLVGISDLMTAHPIGSARVETKIETKFADRQMKVSRQKRKARERRMRRDRYTIEDKDVNRSKKTEVTKGHGGIDSEAYIYEQFIVRILPVTDFSVRQASNETKPLRSDEHLNVLVVALNGVYRHNWQKRMPLSSRFLKDQLRAATLTGFNSLGDGISSNIVPMLTGRLLGELSSMSVNGDEASYADPLPFVWNRFEQQDYATLFAENAADGIFQTDFHGFKEKPVHHYMRPFWQAVDAFESGRDTTSMRRQPKNQLRHRCNALRQVKDRALWQYIVDFFSVYRKSVPKFAFALLNDVHVDAGDGSKVTSATSHSDSEFIRFLESLAVSDDFRQRTVLIVVSGRVQKYGLGRTGNSGIEIEGNNPLALVVLPELFQRLEATNPSALSSEFGSALRRQYQPRHDWSKLAINLAQNVDRLTTPLDIHATLLSLLNVSKLAIPDNGQFASTHRAAVSVLANVPTKRTCQTAAIDPHWCTCTYIERADLAEDTVLKAAEWVIDWINERLSNECRKLGVGQVLSAAYEIPNDVLIKEENKLYFSRLLPFNFTAKHSTTMRYIRVLLTTTDAMTSSRGTTLEATILFNPTSRKFHPAATGNGIFVSHVGNPNDDLQPPGCIENLPQELLHPYCICN